MTDALLFLLVINYILISGWLSDHLLLVSLLIAAVIAALIWRRDRQR